MKRFRPYPRLKLMLAAALLLVISGFGWYQFQVDQPTNLDEYRAWFAKSKNGFSIARKVGGIEYAVQYQPAALVAAAEIAENAADAEHLIKSYGNTYNFVIQLRPLDQSAWERGFSPAALSDLKSTLAHNLQVAFLLETGHEQLKPVIYHYEGPTGPNPSHRFVLGFPNEKALNPEQLTLLFNDALFGGGLLHFALKPNYTSIPALPNFDHHVLL